MSGLCWLQTWAVQTTFKDQFQSVQSCLPVSLQFNAANNATQTDYKFSVNTTSLECAHLSLPARTIAFWSRSES